MHRTKLFLVTLVLGGVSFMCAGLASTANWPGIWAIFISIATGVLAMLGGGALMITTITKHIDEEG